MRYYESKEQVKAVGSFITFAYGYYSFELEDGEVLAFDEINKTVLEEFNLRSNELSNEMFEISYSIIIDDMDDIDFVVLRLDSLKLIK